MTDLVPHRMSVESPDGPGPAHGTTARAVGLALWRHRWTALAVFVVEVAAVFVWLALAPRSYTATATITATPSPALLSSTGNFEDLENSVAELANSRSVLQDVRARLGSARTMTQLRDEVTGTRVAGTVLVRISVTDSAPALAARIADAVAAELPLHDPSGGALVFTQTDPARAPSTASAPDTRIVLLAGVGLGLLVAIAVALLRDAVARRVEGADQLREETGADVLAVVPRPRDQEPVVVDATGDPAATALRSLRVELEFLGSAQPTGAIVIASATADSTVSHWLAANLASALAQVDHRVLVIDADLRGGDAHEVRSALGALDRSPGLYGALRGICTLPDAMRAGPVSGVAVVPAGEPPANSGGSPESLVELRFHQVLAQLDDTFDVVLVCAPSAQLSDDARVMAIGGSLMLVVPDRSVRVSALRRLIGELRSTRTRLLGTVLVTTARRTVG